MPRKIVSFRKFSHIRNLLHVQVQTLQNCNRMSHFHTPWKRQKTKGFLTFSGGIEMEYWREKG